MRKMAFFLMVLAALFLMGSPAQAVPMLNLTDTSNPGVIPAPGSTDANDLLLPIYGSAPRNGYFGSEITLSGGPALVKFTFVGFEAGFDNDFYYGTTQLFSTEDYAPLDQKVGNLGSATYSLGTGLIDFSFYVQNTLGVSNVSGNPINIVVGGITDINFFTSVDGGDGTATSGTSLIVFLDDAGAGPDDNHDDMAIRISIVPEPATMFLLGTGLIGIAGLGRRRFKK